MPQATKTCEMKADISPEYLAKIIQTMEERIDSEDLLNTMAKLDGIQAAMLFAKAYEGVLRWCDDAGVWMHFDGMRWKRQSQAAMTCHFLAMKLARKLLIVLADHPDRATRWYATNLQERAKRAAMIADAKPLLAGKAADLDTDAYLLNAQNGVLNLKSFELVKHDPELNLSKLAPVDFDPEADCPVFRKFIAEVMEDDTGKIEYLQTAIGYALLGNNESRKSFFLYGESNSNGKSTLLSSIGIILGDYALSIDPKLVAVSTTTAKAADPATASLQGIRFLQLPEPEKGMRLDCALFKRLTGNTDTLIARNLYENPVAFIPVCKIFLNTNHLPVVNDDSIFTSGRVTVIPFERHFDESEQDKSLPQKLQAESSGILNWMLEGLKTYYRNEHSFGELPDAVKAATDEYVATTNKIWAFWNEVIVKDRSSSITAKTAFDCYEFWSDINEISSEPKSVFMAFLRANNLLSATGTVGGKTYHGVIKGVKIDDSPLYNPTPKA